MGQRIWMEMSIGGRISQGAVTEFLEQANFALSPTDSPVNRAFLARCIEEKGPLKLEGEVKSDDVAVLEDICQEHGLTYEIFWPAELGISEPILRFWKPGMAEPSETPHLAGAPAAPIQVIDKAIKEGRLSELLAGLRAASGQVPRIFVSKLAPAEAKARNEQAVLEADAPADAPADPVPGALSAVGVIHHLVQAVKLARPVVEDEVDDGRILDPASLEDDLARNIAAQNLEAAEKVRDALDEALDLAAPFLRTPAPVDPELAAIRAQVKAFDTKLNGTAPDHEDARPPDGDDYNEVVGIILNGMAAPARAQERPAERALERIAARLRGDWFDPASDLESDIAGVVRAFRQDGNVPPDHVRDAAPVLLEAVKAGLDWVERSGATDTDPPEYLAMRDAVELAETGQTPPTQADYERTARANGWIHEDGAGWWNARLYEDSAASAADGQIWDTPRSVCQEEDLDIALSRSMRSAEDCRPRGHLEKDGVILRDIVEHEGHEGILITSLLEDNVQLTRGLARALDHLRIEFPAAEVWITAGEHTDDAIQLRAFVPMAQAVEPLPSSLADMLDEIAAPAIGETEARTLAP